LVIPFGFWVFLLQLDFNNGNASFAIIEPNKKLNNGAKINLVLKTMDYEHSLGLVGFFFLVFAESHPKEALLTFMMKVGF
jgi:hypothetical protein